MERNVAFVGATGLLGHQIAEELVRAGRPFRALIRPTAAAERRGRLTQLGVEICRGDLKDPQSVRQLLSGAKVVISTASSTLSRQAGDSIESVDLTGQLALVDLAERAGVEQFIYLSFHSIEGTFPLQDAKRVVEARLKETRMRWSILQPTFFQEVWLSPGLGFDVAKRTARVYGTGTNPVQWIGVRDLARFVVQCLDNPRAERRIIEIGGREALSQLDAVAIVEAALGQKFTVEHVPIEMLIAQRDSAAGSLERSFAALTVQYARGRQVDNRAALGIAPVELGGVADFLRAAARVQNN